jgi:hypothetical protein
MKIVKLSRTQLMLEFAAILLLTFGTCAQMTVPPHVTTPMMTVGKLQDLCNAQARIAAARNTAGNTHSISTDDWVDSAQCAGYLAGVLDSCDDRTPISPDSNVYLNCVPADETELSVSQAEKAFYLFVSQRLISPNAPAREAVMQSLESAKLIKYVLVKK